MPPLMARAGLWPTWCPETDAMTAPRLVVRCVLEVEESLEVVTGGYQGPFKAGLFQAAQHEAPETYHEFLRGLLESAIFHFFAFFRPFFRLFLRL